MAEASGRNLTIDGPQHPAALRVLCFLRLVVERDGTVLERTCPPIGLIGRSTQTPIEGQNSRDTPENGTIRAHKKVLARAYSKRFQRHICCNLGRPAEVQVKFTHRSCTQMS
jgi:hypothetical protein